MDPKHIHAPFSRSRLARAVAIGMAAASFSAVAADAPRELKLTEVKEAQQQSYKAEKASSPKYTTPLLETPRTINVITGDVLKDQGVTSLNDALRNVSGVSTFGAGEGGGGNITTNDKITIRGFSANNDIYVDGIRDIAGYSRDMFNYEQLEVTKGAGSTISGKGSAGGTINLVSKRAQEAEFTVLDASYDEAERLRLTLDANTQFADVGAGRINLLFTEGGDTLGNNIENYRSLGVAPSVSFNLAERTRLGLDLFYMEQDNRPMLGLPWVNEDAAQQIGRPAGPIDSQYWSNYYGVASRDFEKLDMLMATLVFDHEFSDSVRLIGQTRFGNNSKQSTLARPLFKSTRDPVTRLRSYEDLVDLTYVQNIDQENRLAVTQWDLQSNFSTGSIGHQLVTGVELYRETQEKYQLQDNRVLTTPYVSLDTPAPNQSFSGELVRVGKPAEVTGTGAAIYALDTLSLGEHWQVDAGIRWEDYSAKGSTYLRGGKFVEDVRSDGDFFSWSLGLSYQPNSYSNYYVAVANAQDPAGGNMAFSGRTEDQLSQYNALDPQESTNYELGAKWDLLQSQLQLTAAAFLTQKTVTDTDDNADVFLAGEQQAKGLELGLTGAISDDLNLIAGYTWQETEVTKDFNPDTQGNGLTAAPEHSASVWLTYGLDALTLGGGVQYSSGNVFWRQNRAFYESGDLYLVSLMASYDISEQLRVQLNADNLTDEEYVSDYSARGHFRPGAGRNIKLGVRYSF